MYKAVAFDVDGTIVDTHFLINALRDAYFDVRGYAIDEEICETLYGSPVSQSQQIMEFSDEEIALFNRRFRVHLPKYIDHQKIYDGIRDVILQLRELGVKVVINTSRTLEGALEASRQLEWDFASYCDHIITCDLVKNPKPAPDSLYRVQELCGCELDEILFTGDTIFDSKCAINAKVDFALATWGTERRHPAKFYPKNPGELLDIVKDSMR